jgi:hypothetical protein
MNYEEDKIAVNVYNEWRCPYFNMLIFVSSTFQDTHLERDIIQEKIRYTLIEEARKDNIDITLVDMRTGVKDNTTMDHNTWICCENEIQRCCRKKRTGIWFLSLQSSRYGYKSIPKYISTAIFDMLLSRNDKRTSRVLRKWYEMDQNEVPAIYVLTRLTPATEDSFYKVALPTLLHAMEGISLNNNTWSMHKVGRSITEWELLTAVKEGGDRCIWVHRVFIEEVITDKRFCDIYPHSQLLVGTSNEASLISTESDLRSVVNMLTTCLNASNQIIDDINNDKYDSIRYKEIFPILTNIQVTKDKLLYIIKNEYSNFIETLLKSINNFLESYESNNAVSNTGTSSNNVYIEFMQYLCDIQYNINLNTFIQNSLNDNIDSYLN